MRAQPCARSSQRAPGPRSSSRSLAGLRRRSAALRATLRLLVPSQCSRLSDIIESAPSARQPKQLRQPAPTDTGPPAPSGQPHARPGTRACHLASRPGAHPAVAARPACPGRVIARTRAPPAACQVACQAGPSESRRTPRSAAGPTPGNGPTGTMTRTVTVTDRRYYYVTQP